MQPIDRCVHPRYPSNEQMSDILQKALVVERESSRIEFKREFDPTSRAQWCEVIKDIVAIANSGGGVIIFGLENDGQPSGKDVTALAKVDPADVANKVTSFTGAVDLEFEIESIAKAGQALVAFLIHPAPMPVVFEKPGSYDLPSGAKGNAFAQGTIYFRHGAKSEPARASDLVRAIDRLVKLERKSLLSGVRKVTEAPRGARIVALSPTRAERISEISNTTVRAVQNPEAIPVYLTRDSKKTSGTFVHESVSAALFDEINNIIDTNGILARGQKKFFLGLPVYFRIYAERRFVAFDQNVFDLLFHSAVHDFYSPALFWATKLPVSIVAKTMGELYLRPHSPHVHFLMRSAILLGTEFSEWMFNAWCARWKDYVQKPSFYDTFKEMKKKAAEVGGRMSASKIKASTQILLPGEKPISGAELIDNADKADKVLSLLCLKIFESAATDGGLRTLARDLDCLAHGSEFDSRKSEISAAIMAEVRNKEILPIEQTPEG